MSRVRFASLRPLLAVAAVLAIASVPLACAHGSSETDLGYGGAGGGSSIITTSSSATSGSTTMTGGFPSSSSTNSSSTSGFPSSSSTSGFPSSSSTSGFPSSSSTSGFPSSSSTSGFPVTSSSSSGGGSSACDSSGDCGTCASCADGSVCIIQSLNCQFDFDCPSIIDCVNACPANDNACPQACLDAYPASAQLFLDYYDCLACSCQVDCQIPAGSCP